MRIGVLTYHAVPNFGAQLQTLSTICYLRNNGHEPIVLNWYPKDLEDMYAGFIPHEQLKCHDDFANIYFPLSSLCRNEQELLSEIEHLQLDAIFLGSDALFKYIPIIRRRKVVMGRIRPRILPVFTPSVERLHGNPFWGGFASKLKIDIPVVTYAVSSQNCPYDDMTFFEKILMKKFLNNIKYISVRDDWTQKMVKEITNRSEVNIYPDPVFAFNQNVGDIIPTKEDILKKYEIDDRYILLSFWTGNCSEEYIYSLAEEIKKNGFLPVTLPTPSGNNSVKNVQGVVQPISPMDWYALIIHSDGYIGELMHPIVVCLHNSVPCFSFDQYGGRKQERGVVFPKQLPYREESSKIYHIIHAAGFDDNRVSNFTMKEYPNPSLVIDKIKRFDRDRCHEFSNVQFENYQEGMMKVLSYLHK